MESVGVRGWKRHDAKAEDVGAHSERPGLAREESIK